MRKLCNFLVMILILSGCTGKHPSADKIFSNAQILYQDKEENPGSKKNALEMPSYFLEIEYAPKQTKLSAAQVKKIERIFEKLIYPEEYQLYASFGASTKSTEFINLSLVFKRAEDLKKRYAKRVKKMKIGYLKNQKPNCLYLRLLG